MKHGTTIRETRTVLGRPVVGTSLVETADPDRLVVGHLSGPLPASREYVCTEQAAGTLVTYTQTTQLRGRWTMFAAHLTRTAEREMKLSLAALRWRLETTVENN
jgi:hypothetical protein